MLKKLMSDALLSVVMDKKARQKLKERQGKSAPEQNPTPRPQAPESEDEILSTISDVLAEARAEAMGADSPKGKAPAPDGRVEPKTPSRPPSRETTPEREELIRQAMNIHRQKQDVLSELPEETREKLMVMAMYAIDPDSLSPEARRIAEDEAVYEQKNQGLVDDTGSNASRRKR